MTGGLTSSDAETALDQQSHSHKCDMSSISEADMPPSCAAPSSVSPVLTNAQTCHHINRM
jgi:hypothetical protein